MSRLAVERSTLAQDISENTILQHNGFGSILISMVCLLFFNSDANLRSALSDLASELNFI